VTRRAKRSLSQNFLVDPNLRRKLVESLDPRPDEAILEVGPGHGELTELLLARTGHLVVVEKDDQLVEDLRRRWPSRTELVVVHGDALEVDLAAELPPERPYSILSNIPYAITSPLLFRFLDLEPPPRRIVVTVQREVADRIVATPGSKTYGALSVGVQVRARAVIAFRLGRQAFRPVPAVDSAAVVLDGRDDAPAATEYTHIRRLTRAAFGRRRKQLQKILRTAPELGLDSVAVDAVLREARVDPRARPEQLSPEQYVLLSDLAARWAQSPR
jgi:16S rRNA (adenine1518-N6/adenine1519-N6)-dimethyltransferase